MGPILVIDGRSHQLRCVDLASPQRAWRQCLKCGTHRSASVLTQAPIHVRPRRNLEDLDLFPNPALQIATRHGPRSVPRAAAVHRSTISPRDRRAPFTAVHAAAPNSGRNAGSAGARSAVATRLPVRVTAAAARRGDHRTAAFLRRGELDGRAVAPRGVCRFRRLRCTLRRGCSGAATMTTVARVDAHRASTSSQTNQQKSAPHVLPVLRLPGDLQGKDGEKVESRWGRRLYPNLRSTFRQ